MNEWLANRQVIEGALATLLIRGVQAGSAYLLQIILARLLSLDEFGVYALTMAWVTVLSTAGASGMPNLLVRFLPESVTTEDWGGARGVLTWSLFAVVLVSSGIATVLFCIAMAANAGPASLGAALCLGAVAVPALALGATLVQAGRALGHAVLTFAPQALVGNVGLLLVSGLWVAIGHTLTTFRVIGFAVLLAFLVIVVQLQLLWRALPLGIRYSRAEYRPRVWLRVAAPLMATACLYILVERTDLLLVGTLLTSSDAGLYSAAARTAALVSFVPFAISAVAAPRISSLHAQGRRAQLRSFLRRMRWWTFWPSAALALAMVVFGRQLLGLFGAAYASAWPILAILCGGQVMAAAAGPVAVALLMTGREAVFVVVLAIGVVTNLILNLLLIPTWGSAGAAAGTATSLAAWTALATYMEWRRQPIQTAQLPG